MKERLIILNILNENPEIGRHKFDRLYYSRVDYDKSWVPIINELRENKMVFEKELKITQKGRDYLEQSL